MPSVPISNAPYFERLRMPDFQAITSARKGPAKACRFIARIVPRGSLITGYTDITKDLMYLCEAAEYPSRGFLNVDVRYYGPNQKLPYQSTYEDITLTFICRNDSSPERKFFDDWQTTINPPNTFDFNYRDDYCANIEIFQYDDQNEAQYQFTLLDAYPVLVNTQQLTWADDQFLRLGVTFSYTWWIRPGLDPAVRNSSGTGASFKLVPYAIR